MNILMPLLFFNVYLQIILSILDSTFAKCFISVSCLPVGRGMLTINHFHCAAITWPISHNIHIDRYVDWCIPPAKGTEQCSSKSDGY